MARTLPIAVVHDGMLKGVERMIKTPLPCYRNGQTQVEAFRITGIDNPDIGLVLHGDNHIAHPVRTSWFSADDLQIGHYYVRYQDGKEFILHSGAFEASYVPVQ